MNILLIGYQVLSMVWQQLVKGVKSFLLWAPTTFLVYWSTLEIYSDISLSIFSILSIEAQ